MWNLDPYLQTAWQLSDRWSLDAGVRFSTVNFDANDYYVTASDPDDSGNRRYHRWLPAASLKYAIDDGWNAYVSAGRGFETPTLNELSYRARIRPGSISTCSRPPAIPWSSAAKNASATVC